jgi:mannitol 2-dehydrogenase
MDARFEEDEQVFTHPRDPYTRVDILPSSRHVRVEVDGVTIAESSKRHLVDLNARTLDEISARGVAVPRYDRSALRPRILHVGVGGFHRAHLAFYMHELAATGSDWGIRGLGVLDADARMDAILRSQDYLYTLVERGDGEPRSEVIGSIIDYVLAIDDPAAVAVKIADPETAILSLTITESGYSLDKPNPTIESIAGGLARRRAETGAALTILSCDNIAGNGRVAREAVLRFCDERNAELARWVETTCSFPNSMVDRITPQTTDRDRAWLRDTLGIDDGWPVIAEPFRQWVIEDEFASGRPPLEEVGVLFSDRVHDWELYKLRMLNATHSCIAYLSALAGIVYVDEAMATPPLRRFLERFLRYEAIPTLKEIPEYPRLEYAMTVLDRFASTGVRDQIARLCIDGTAKFPVFLIPTIERQLEREGPVECAALALAGWARYLATTPAAGRASDPSAEHSARYAKRAMDDPVAFLDLTTVFPPAVRDSARFRGVFAASSHSLASLGPIGALEALPGTP